MTTVYLLLLSSLITFVNADNLALLSGTLRTFQRAACDDQTVTLTCPPGTSISVQLARYGNSAPTTSSLCQTSPSDPQDPNSNNVSCIWPKTTHYSLLQTVVEACQKKRACKFHTSPKTFGGDPCPGVRKYVEVAYKCQPYEFRSKIACQNDMVQLRCNPNSRIAIYSASYGRTEYESVQCPQPQGVPEETCLVSYATETVMRICHGKRHCTLSASPSTFGSPCRKESRMYLKVVFTCVARKVLQEQFEERLGDDEQNDPDLDFEYDSLDDAFRDTDAFSPSPNLAGGRHNHSGGLIPSASTTLSTDVANNQTLSEENKERFYLYLILSVGGGLLTLLSLVIARLLWQRHMTKRRLKYENSTQGATSLPNGFTDDISEVDADIDLTTVTSPVIPPGIIHQVPGEVVRYGSEGSAPRSLSRSGNSQYYYG